MFVAKIVIQSEPVIYGYGEDEVTAVTAAEELLETKGYQGNILVTVYQESEAGEVAVVLGPYHATFPDLAD